MPQESASSNRLPNVARAGGIMVLSLLLSRVLALLRDMIIAWKFGSNIYTDSYRLAFSIPDLLFFLIAGGALSSAFIPVFSEYLHTDREDEAWKVFSVVVTVMSVVISTLIVVAWIFAIPLVHLVAPGKPESYMPLIASMSRIVLPAQYAFFIGGIMFGTLYSRQRFAAPGLGPNIYNLGIIFGAVALAGFFTPGVMGMSWGALIGAVAGNLLMPLIAMRGIGAKFRPSFDVSHPGVKKVFKLMIPVVLGLSLSAVYPLIMHIFGSFFPAGSNTWLEYSNKLMQAPLGVFGQSLAIAVFPALSQFYAQKRMDLFRKQMESTLRTVLYITVPISAIMIAMAPKIVAAFYQRGHFSHDDTLATASLLRMFAIGISAWCIHPILMRSYFAVQSTVTPIVLGTASTAIFLILIYALKDTALGLGALPLAGSIAAIALILMMLAAVRRKVGDIDYRGIGETFLKSALCSTVCGLAVYGAVYAIGSRSIFRPGIFVVVEVLGLSLLAAWLYYFMTRGLKMQETAYIDRALARLSRRDTSRAEGAEAAVEAESEEFPSER